MLSLLSFSSSLPLWSFEEKKKRVSEYGVGGDKHIHSVIKLLQASQPEYLFQNLRIEGGRYQRLTIGFGSDLSKIKGMKTSLTIIRPLSL